MISMQSRLSTLAANRIAAVAAAAAAVATAAEAWVSAINTQARRR